MRSEATKASAPITQLRRLDHVAIVVLDTEQALRHALDQQGSTSRDPCRPRGVRSCAPLHSCVVRSSNMREYT
jgi:hypothetical protein